MAEGSTSFVFGGSIQHCVGVGRWDVGVICCSLFFVFGFTLCFIFLLVIVIVSIRSASSLFIVGSGGSGFILCCWWWLWFHTSSSAPSFTDISVRFVFVHQWYRLCWLCLCIHQRRWLRSLSAVMSSVLFISLIIGGVCFVFVHQCHHQLSRRLCSSLPLSVLALSLFVVSSDGSDLIFVCYQ